MKYLTSIIRTLSLALTATLFLPPSSLYALDVIPEDLSTWVEKGTVLTYGTPGSWDEKARGPYPIGVTKKEGIFYLHYLGGFDGCWNADGDINHRSVGLATSTDGINFTKHAGNPILKPHDFVSVSSHEEGIRTAKIRYLPGPGMWLGYFGVESPGGADNCPFMGTTAQCGCNIPVDASIYAATSTDGINWTPKGEVSGVYNGQEKYIDDFQYRNGEYYLWSHRAQGGQGHSASKGTDSMPVS
ncbi:MAG: hypothetical protein COB30_003735 [Ectothiorhodospiraceae bacterium]|nr:hypothetical protein [Ectothiorhodospiraceae bacterium]